MSLTRYQYDSILRSYESVQSQHREEYRVRINELYTECPRLEEIQKRISSLSVTTAKALLTGSANSTTDYHREMMALKSERHELLKQQGYDERILTPACNCEDCKDTGYLPNQQKCHCFIAKEIELLYSQSGIRDVLKRENFEHFTYEYYSDTKTDPATGTTSLANMKNIVNISKEFIRTFGTNEDNLLFFGTTGVGKTFLTNCIAKELIEQSYSVIYLSAIQLFDLLAKDTFSREKNVEYTSNILNCDLLIIDDLGTEMSNSFTLSALFGCLNERLLAKRSTIISSNLSLKDLQDHYSDRLFSRILGNYKLLKLFGDDIRLKKRN